MCAYDILHVMMRLLFWGVWSSPSLSLLLDPLVSVRVPTMGQEDLFKNYSYLRGQCAKTSLKLPDCNVRKLTCFRDYYSCNILHSCLE